MMIRKTTETGGVGRVKLLRISGRVLKIERSLTEARKTTSLFSHIDLPGSRLTHTINCGTLFCILEF